MKFLLFDILLYFFGIITYGGSAAVSFSFANFFWSENYLVNTLIISLSFLLFLHTFILILGLLKKIFQPKLIVGDFPISLNKDYFAWGLNSVFCGLFFSSPFTEISQLLFSTNWLFYRSMGMKRPFSTLIGQKTIIRQPELITLGSHSIIGLGAVLTCHFSPNTKTHTQQRITVGNHCVVGGAANIAPGVTISDRSVIGSKSSLFPSVVIGSGVRMGAFCRVDSGVTIPDNVRIKSHSRVTRDLKITSGDILEGSPAKVIKKGDHNEL